MSFTISSRLVECLPGKRFMYWTMGNPFWQPFARDISENRNAEASDHVKRFHELFFHHGTGQRLHRKQCKGSFAFGRPFCYGAIPVLQREQFVQPGNCFRHQHDPSNRFYPDGLFRLFPIVSISME